MKQAYRILAGFILKTIGWAGLAFIRSGAAETFFRKTMNRLANRRLAAGSAKKRVRLMQAKKTEWLDKRFSRW